MQPISLIRAAAIGIVVALVLVLITFLIADWASGPLRAAQFGGSEVEEIPVIGALIATVIGGLVGVGLAFVAKRFSDPEQVFLTVAAIGLVLYGIMALVAADDWRTGYWLNVLHIAAAVPIVGWLREWLAPARLMRTAAVA